MDCVRGLLGSSYDASSSFPPSSPALGIVIFFFILTVLEVEPTASMLGKDSTAEHLFGGVTFNLELGSY